MPDWQELVRKRLSGLKLGSAEREEVHAELAVHLEESYESLRTKGLPEQAAMQQTLAQVADWQDLRREIQIARTVKENLMNDRVRQLWLPGLLTFALSMGLLELVQKFGARPIVLDLDKGTPVLMFYTPWLLALPLAGALGAYLSKRAGGSARIVLASSIFPVLPFGVVFMIAGPVGLVISHSLAHHIVTAAFFSMSVGWVLAPGIALLVGGFLMQLLISRRSSTHGISMS
ncbi:MAG: hypothetical protein DMG48_12780 [Acidobacteria bacterium]|nr:MAG: hypothetical protein DMG48_12780 [Acidobacteriota bacterium]